MRLNENLLLEIQFAKRIYQVMRCLIREVRLDLHHGQSHLYIKSLQFQVHDFDREEETIRYFC